LKAIGSAHFVSHQMAEHADVLVDGSLRKILHVDLIKNLPQPLDGSRRMVEMSFPVGATEVHVTLQSAIVLAL
jgi:hypothetical protein